MSDSGTTQLPDEAVLVRVENLTVEFKTNVGVVQAVSDISFDVLPGETLGIVGESGCGKSTTGRAMLRLTDISNGRILFEGNDITHAKGNRLRALRRHMQMVFQDPVSSLNPRREVQRLIAEGLVVSKATTAEKKRVVAEMMVNVGLPVKGFASRLPRQLSGGQAQRVALARALAVRPKLLVCDEAVSALDVSVQAQIINLVEDVKDEFDLTVVFISHDLGVIKTVSDRVMVMYLGKICEVGTPEDLYRNPAHPYTRGLLDSVPAPNERDGFTGPALDGDIPSPLDPPTGCRFRTRCAHAEDICSREEPVLREASPRQFVACHFPLSPEVNDGKAGVSESAGVR